VPAPSCPAIPAYQPGPFKHETLCPRREIASHPPGFNLNGDLVFTIDSVEVGEAMFAEEHPDDDAEEPRNLRHFVGEARGDVDESTGPAEEGNS
jgi:hypothetical protein